MSFVIAVTGGVERGVQSSAEKLVTTLEKGEAAGARVGAGIARGSREGSTALDRTTQAAGRARDALGRFTGAAREGSSATDRMARSASNAELGFRAVALAIQREQRMLEQINAPLRRYEQGLQALDSLHDRGRISTDQYAESVRRLNKELARSETIRPTSAAPAVAAAAPKSGGMLAGLGGVGGLAAAAGLTFGASELRDMVKNYQDLQNKMRVVAGDGESVSSVFKRIQASATATRATLADTTGAYQRLSGATKELGMSGEATLRLTERISKAMKVSGASTAEAQAATQQLSQAIASGRLQGDEFRSIGENAPYVLGLLAESLGVTRGKLRELASEGKLTSSVVVDAFTKMGSKIDSDFSKTVPTLSDQWAQFQDKLTIVVGKVFEASGTFTVLGGALGVVGDLLGIASDIVGGLKDAFDEATESMGPFGEALRTALNPLKLVRDGIAALKEAARQDAEAEAAGGGWAAQMKQMQQRGKLQQEISEADAKAYLEEMAALKLLHAEYERIDKVSRTLAAAKSAGVEGLPGFDLDAAKVAAETASNMKRWFGIEVPAAYAEAVKASEPLAAGIAKLKEQRAGQQLAEDIERATNKMTGFNKSLDDNAKHWRSVSDELADVNGAIDKLAKDRAALAAATGKDPLIEMHGKGKQDALSTTRQELELQQRRLDLTDELNNREYQYGQSVTATKKALRERKLDIEATAAAVRDGKYTAEEAAFAWKQLGLEESRAAKLLKEIRQPSMDYQANVAALNTLLNHGRITLDEYGAAIRRVTDAYAGSEMRQLLEGVQAPKSKPQVSLGSGPVAGGLFDDAITMDGDVSRERATALAEYRAEVERLTAGLEGLQAATEPNLERDMAAGVAAAADQTARWNRELELLRLQTQSDGFARGFEKIRADIMDTAGALENALVNAFRNAEQALVDFVTTGEFSMRKFVDAALADLTRLIIRQAAAGLINAIGSGIGGGGYASALGTGATQAFQGLYSPAPSTPGFAHGGSITAAGGTSGIDTNLAVARISNGETMTITPAGQAPPGQAQQPKVTVVNVYDRSEMRGYMEQEGEGFVLNALRRHDPAIRGRTSGR
jgi:tape measure domain-containing protein